MTALEYFRFLAPAFEAVEDSTVSSWITMSENLTNTGCLDDERKAMANALYAAHLLAVTPSATDSSSCGGGSVKRQKEGDLEVEFTALQGSDTWAGQTPYGQQYLDITKVCSGYGILTRVC